MKRFLSALVVSAITAFLFICNIPTGAYTYPLDRDNARSLVLVTNTPMPPPSAQSTPVYAPQIAAVEAMEAVPTMSNEMYILIVIVLSAIVGALIFVLRSYGIALRDSLPPSFVSLMPVMFNALTDLSKRTASPADDKLVELLKELLGEPATVEAEEKPADNPLAVG